MSAFERMRLFQLASQALPIGGYSHSHGLEAAIEAGLVRDEASLATWLGDLLRFSLASYEAPLLLDFCRAWALADGLRIATLNLEFLASRESAELRAASVQMGYSLRLLVGQFGDFPAALRVLLDAIDEPVLPCVWAALATGWRLDAQEALLAYLWAWAENQVLVAVKSVPLGQSAGQRVLRRTGELIAALEPGPEGLAGTATRSNFAPALAILSSCHETQYSRLFRS